MAILINISFKEYDLSFNTLISLSLSLYIYIYITQFESRVVVKEETLSFWLIVAVYIISLMQEVIKEIKAFIEKTIVLTITVANRNVMLVASNSYG